MSLRKHARFLYQPVLPLGKNRTFVTASKAHWALAEQTAVEGTVMLKNDGTLPLEKGSKICLFGLGAGDFQFGGGGSGKVFTDKLITLADGLAAAEAEGKVQFFRPLVDYYTAQIDAFTREARETMTAAQYNSWRAGILMPMPVLPEELYQEAKAFGDTAIFCLTRYSAEGDVNGDRKGGEGDFYLWKEEEALLDRLYKDFDKVVVVINSCGAVSTMEFKENPKVGAILYPLYGGGVAGQALTKILLGEENPSGHLQHTLAKQLEDYPSTKDFHTYPDHVDYTEDIFVGYRYFETFAPEKVAYPFGFGLSFTTFDVKTTAASLEKNTVKLDVAVRNTGKVAGKEVVQVYMTAPQGVLGKAKKILCAFQKPAGTRRGDHSAFAF